MVTEEIQFYGPSGRLVHRWGPAGPPDDRQRWTSRSRPTGRRTPCSTRPAPTSSSFVIDDEIVGEIEVPVFVQHGAGEAPQGRSRTASRKSDVIWVGVEANGAAQADPVLVRLPNGKILVLSQREPGPEEQTVPGHPRRVRARRRDDPAQGPRHRARRVPRRRPRARGRRVGGGGQGRSSTGAGAASGPPSDCARALARLVRHRRAHARSSADRATAVLVGPVERAPDGGRRAARGPDRDRASRRA